MGGSATYNENVEKGCLVELGGVRRVSSVAPVSHFLHRRRPLFCLVEHDGLWVLVHHLSHVSQDVLLGDDTQETPEHRREVRSHFKRFSAPVLRQ